MVSYLRYANQSATRNQPLDPRLVQALGYLGPMGITAEVFSGGQDATGPNRVGSHRHDHGGAGDIRFYKDGRALSWANPNDLPTFQDIVKQGKAAGITGFGAGPGYMGEGTMHIGFGSPGVWGAGGKGANAPEWLRAAYNGAAAGSLPAASVPDVADGPKGQEVYATPSQPIDNTMVASTGGQGGSGDPITSDMAAYAMDGEKNIWERLSGIGKALDDSIPQAPSAGGSYGGQGGNMLAQVMNQPNMGDTLLQRRLAFLKRA